MPTDIMPSGVPAALPGDLLERYTRWIDGTPRTVQTYTQATRRLLQYLADHGINAPQRADIISYRDALTAQGLKPSTVSLYVTAAKLFFAWTAQEGIYPDIAQRIKGPRMDAGHAKDALTADQVKRLLESIDRDTATGKRDYAMIALMIAGALRTVEVTRANVGDLVAGDQGARLFVQGKGKADRSTYVKVPAAVETALRDYLATRANAKPEDPLFTGAGPTNAGGRLMPQTISHIVKYRLRQAGMDSERLTAHSLRHSGVTLALLAGIPLQEVKEYARHSNLATTLIYDHSLSAAGNRCAAAVSAAVFDTENRA